MQVGKCFISFLVLIFVTVVPDIICADEFKIAVLRDDSYSVQHYEPLVQHLAKAGIKVRLLEVPTHQSAARMVSAGEIDALINGSGIPGSMVTIHHLKQKRLFASFKPEDLRLKQAMTFHKRFN